MTAELIFLQNEEALDTGLTEEIFIDPEVESLPPLEEETLFVTTDILVDVEGEVIDDSEAMNYVYPSEAYYQIYDDTGLITPEVLATVDDGIVAPAPAVYLFEGLQQGDLLIGTESTDDFFDYHASDHMYGRGGDDTIKGLSGDDSLFGNRGDDLLQAGSGNDDLHGGKGHDTLNGALGADTLYGGAGEDVLNGGRGADMLYGGAQADTLDGGLGNDTLTGGRGADTFLFSSGHDVITDYTAGEDVLIYGDGSINFSAVQQGADVYISIEGDTESSLTILNTDLESLTWMYGSAGDDGSL